ncbi:hypothetical protein C8A01DRAFT_21220 [Parachaetomium inaequale]|uniref:Uncharacterized protein n=1 Tax=Parachaetomium inaequale TaxID=2588326 RepID=A0AAN6SKD3_9PEZI|nr:hypothetical protein C8A01DRAFT_21220 [Parachaetomium inaequale]
MAPGTGGLSTGGGEKSVLVAGPAPPPGRIQPIRAYQSNKDMDDDDDDDDDNNGLAEGTPFIGLKDKSLAGMLMEVVKADDRDTVYYIVNELIGQL